MCLATARKRLVAFVLPGALGLSYGLAGLAQQTIPANTAPPPADSGLIQNQMQERLNQVRQLQQLPGQAQAPANEDPDVAELQAVQKKIDAQYGALNAVNPMATDTSSAAGMVKGGSKAELQSFGSIQRDWLSKPWFKQFATTMMASTQDPAYMKAVGELVKNPNMRWMYVGIVIWTIICWLFKRRVLAATDRFFPRLLVGFGMYLIYMGGYFLVSYTLLGPPVQTVLGVILPAIFTAGKGAAAAFLAGSPK